jgi:hypothetical protein
MSEMTTGLTVRGVIMVGAWPNAGRTVAAATPAVLETTNSRRESFLFIWPPEARGRTGEAGAARVPGVAKRIAKGPAVPKPVRQQAECPLRRRR